LRSSIPISDIVPDLALLEDKRQCPEAWLREGVVVELAVLERQLIRKLLRLERCAVPVQVSDVGGEMVVHKSPAAGRQIQQGFDETVEENGQRRDEASGRGDA
jgi:hypothetical protein